MIIMTQYRTWIAMIETQNKKAPSKKSSEQTATSKRAVLGHHAMSPLKSLLCLAADSSFT